MQTCESISKNYPKCDIEIFKDIHEYGGCFLQNEGFPGMDNSEVSNYINININSTLLMNIYVALYIY